MVACAFFDGSACGVTVTVMVSGLGAEPGAVYVAMPCVTVPPAPCVVTTVSVPQAVPLQPGPESAQESIVLGFEPGTGVSVATTVAELPAGTPCGAAIWRVKLLVMVIAAVACFVESATLCAVIVADAADGRTGGAV